MREMASPLCWDGLPDVKDTWDFFSLLTAEYFPIRSEPRWRKPRLDYIRD